MRGITIGKVSRKKAIMSEKTGTSTMAIWSMRRCCVFLYLLDEQVRNCLDYLIDYWPFLDVCNEPHLSSIHGVIMTGDIIEIYLAGFRGETVFATHSMYASMQMAEHSQLSTPI